MSLKSTQHVVSKTEPQSVTKTRYLIFSRLDPKLAREVGHKPSIKDWECGLEFDDEKRAQQELAWLSNRSFLKEFSMVRIRDSLNDEIPF